MHIHLITASPNALSVLQSLLKKHFDLKIHNAFRRPLPTSYPGHYKKGKPQYILEQFITILRMIFSINFYERNVVLISLTVHSHYVCLAFARLLQSLGLEPKLYLCGFFIRQMGQKSWVKNILKFLFTKNVALMAQSTFDAEYVKTLSPYVDVRYHPFSRHEINEVEKDNIVTGEYIFVGGYSNRDFDIVMRCAKRLASIKFVVVFSSLNKITEKIPPNVSTLQDIEQKRFYNLLAGSKLVIIPLLQNVGSSGQLVTLAAMQLRKVIIYANFNVISQYFEDGFNGLMYKAGDVDCLIAKIESVFDDEEKIKSIGNNARKSWEQYFQRKNYEEAIYQHIIEFLHNSEVVNFRRKNKLNSE